ncbi:MAG: right-handed parallel beta-helix repeat-containing protein, partial [candidate division WOR-3 bacterium]
GGDITLRAYSGTYLGDLDLGTVGNDSWHFTMEAVPGETPVIQATGGSTPAVSLTSAHDVTIRGLTMNGYYGIRMWYTGSDSGCCRCSIIGNNINGSYYGTYLYRGCNNVFAGNTIRTSGYYCFYFYGYPSGSTNGNYVYNNMFISTYSYGYGAYLYYHDRLTFVYNSLHGSWYYAMFLGYSPNCQFKNNIVYNRYSPPYCNLYWDGSEGFESDYNCWWNEDTANPRRVFFPWTLQMWQDSTGLDSNSIDADPMFVSETDLHLRAGSPCIDSGLAMAWIPYDIDGDSRDSCPDIGADEFTGVGPPMAGTYYIHPNPDSGDYVSFLEALGDLFLRGFGGDVAFLAYSGFYPGDIDLAGLGNDPYKFTMQAVPDQTPVIQATGGSSPAVSMTSARNIKIQGLTISGYYGLRMWYTGSDSGCQNCSIVGNNINGSYYGAYIYRGCHNVFAGNVVTTAGYYGLYWYGYPTGSTNGNYVYNNFIHDYSGYGMYCYYHDSLQLLYNSVTSAASPSSLCLMLGYNANCRIMNNIFYYQGRSTTAAHLYGNTGLDSDYNCWWTHDSLHRVIGGMTLEDWRAATGLDSNSIAHDPLFVSGTDLHLQASSPCIDSGLAMAGVLYDIDGELRDSTPCIGADEWVGTGMAEGMGKPLVVDLFRPAPNPASGPVRIRWQVPCLSRVSLKAYDISGRCVATLVDRMVETGVYVTVWHGRDNSGRRLAPGVYFYTLETGDKTLTHKVVLTGVR